MSSSSHDNHSDPKRKPTFARRMLKYAKRLVLYPTIILCGYLLIAAVGLIPVNRDFSESENGVQIFVFSGEFHSDIIVPIEAAGVDWRTKFPSNEIRFPSHQATHLSIGWGDREFYLNTPTWSDLKVSTAISALLLPSETVMHVSYESTPALSQAIKSVRISDEQYLALVEHISSSFKADSVGKYERIPGAQYHEYDGFYVANGNYNCFRTCNCWTGEGLRAAGIKTGWFTPFPKTPFLYFPK